LTSLENHEEKVEHSSSELTYGKEQIRWRRSKVLELDSQGYTQHEIVQKLQIAKGTVNSDLACLRKQAQENLRHHISETIPELYQRCMTGMQRNLKQTVEICESSSDLRIKLEARKIISECYRIIMDLATSSSVIPDAMKFVTHKQEQIESLRRSDSNNNTIAEAAENKTSDRQEQTTTNGVF
jgi:FKBP-type peptidyl-prolyl cis-trans isomerase (trigger factor)